MGSDGYVHMVRKKENSHAERTVGEEPVTLTGITRDSH